METILVADDKYVLKCYSLLPPPPKGHRIMRGDVLAIISADLVKSAALMFQWFRQKYGDMSLKKLAEHLDQIVVCYYSII